MAAVYGAGDGSLTLVNYAAEKTNGTVSGLNGLSASVFATRNGHLCLRGQPDLARVHGRQPGEMAPPIRSAFPASIASASIPAAQWPLPSCRTPTTPTIPASSPPRNRSPIPADLPPGPRRQSTASRRTPPAGACFRLRVPTRSTLPVTTTALPLVFDRPVKAVFSADGSTAYVLNCGPECGGNNASISLLPVAPMIFPLGQASGLLPCNTAPCSNSHAVPIVNIPIPGGASNALVTSSTMYVVGQHLMPDGYFGGIPDRSQSRQQYNRPVHLQLSKPRLHQRWNARRCQPHVCRQTTTPSGSR